MDQAAVDSWISDNVLDLSGKVVIVTGANSGLGLETAKVMAGKGAEVVLACRNQEKGQTALNQILGIQYQSLH